MSDVVIPLAQLDLVFKPEPWAFARDKRAEIDAYFAAQQRSQPALWNGQILLLRDYRLAAVVMHGTFLETDYASFLYWRALGCPAAGVWDCFGAAAVVSSDGAVLLGEMAASTSNAGAIYFPCGTPDPGDLKGRVLDLDFSVARELEEETGLAVSTFRAELGWSLARSGTHVALIKTLHASEDTAALRARVDRFLASEKKPELAAIHLVRGPNDLPSAVQDHARLFLAHYWARSGKVAP